MSAGVILLKAPAQDGRDPYKELFESSGYNVAFVPVLETAWNNLDELKRILLDCESSQMYGGVIVTSARASEAWKTVVQGLTCETASIESKVDWSSLPFYAVGNATASALRSIRDVCGDSRFVPGNIRGHSESGTSERLARFILEDTAKTGNSKATMLYLTGDKNRDTLPRALAEGGVTLTSLQVYATHRSSTFVHDLENIVNSTLPARERWWITFFAPSAAEFALPHLRKLFDFPESEAVSRETRILVAAIGSTTSAFLRDKMKLCVNVVAAKPTPDDIVEAIINYDNRCQLSLPTLPPYNLDSQA